MVGLSQGSSQAGLGDNTNAMLFDNLIQHFSFVNKSGKELCKFKGNLSELSDFVKLVLEIEGEWHTAKDPNPKRFQVILQRNNFELLAVHSDIFC